MSEPKRIRLSRAKGWRLPENTVVVNRPTKWGNPFVVGKDGDAAYCVKLHRHMLAGYAALDCTPTVDEQKAARIYAVEHLDELTGKNLACWCAIDKPCHADTLLQAANRVCEVAG
jgi:hypothetical protein